MANFETHTVMLIALMTVGAATGATSTSPKESPVDGAARPTGDGDRRWDSPYLRDILDWAEDHAHNNNVEITRLDIDGLVTKAEQEKLAKQRKTSTCAQMTIKNCDLQAMAQLLITDDSPCTLLQEYEMCVARETALCPSGEGALLQSAVRHLVVGFQQQGHCVGVRLQSETVVDEDDEDTSSERSAENARPCFRRGSWMCINSFIEDLKMIDASTCASVANFRHCLHMRSSTCSNDSANPLIRGSKGLARLYRRLTHQC